MRIGCFLSLPAVWGLVRVLLFLCCWSALVGRLSVLECAFWGFLLCYKETKWLACIGKPKLEQETIEGTHAQETSAYQRRPTTQHAAQGSNPSIRALYMQLARYHTHIKPHRLPPVPQAQTSTAPTRGRNKYHPSAHKTKDEAPGQLPGAQKHV